MREEREFNKSLSRWEESTERAEKEAEVAHLYLGSHPLRKTGDPSMAYKLFQHTQSIQSILRSHSGYTHSEHTLSTLKTITRSTLVPSSQNRQKCHKVSV